MCACAEYPFKLFKGIHKGESKPDQSWDAQQKSVGIGSSDIVGRSWKAEANGRSKSESRLEVFGLRISSPIGRFLHLWIDSTNSYPCISSSCSSTRCSKQQVKSHTLVSMHRGNNMNTQVYINASCLYFRTLTGNYPLLTSD